MMYILYTYNQQSLLMILFFFSRNVFIVQRSYFPKQVWMRLGKDKKNYNLKTFAFFSLANVLPNQTTICSALVIRQGVKYLFFASSRSVKMRGSSAFSVGIFLRKVCLSLKN
jgi:hypothetical protein